MIPFRWIDLIFGRTEQANCMSLILAIDQGTTNTKALLVDGAGKVIFNASAAMEIFQPQPGLVEQEPAQIWASVVEVMGACVAVAAEKGWKIDGIALSNQRETSVIWHPEAFEGMSGRPASKAMTWQCRRGAGVCERVKGSAELVRKVTGLPLDPLASATKWAWCLEEKPELGALAEAGKLCLGTIDTWLLYNLTGGVNFATDHTNASRTALLDLERMEWSAEMMALFGIPQQALAKLQPSSGEFGICTTVKGLEGVPVVAMIGDSHGALVGHGCYESGAVKATYGTGSSLMMLSPKLAEPTEVVARTIAWSTPAGVQYALEGNIAMSGATVQWVGEFLGLENPARDAAKLAETVPDAAGVVLVPAMVGLGAPYWDTAARGVVAHLERAHKAAHLARAAVDSIAYQVADVLEAMEQAAGVELPVLLADGGATKNSSLMQMQADVLNRPTHRSMEQELSARGAALLGGLALGWWKSFAELAALEKTVDIFDPKMTAAERGKLRSAWKLAVKRARLRE